MLISILTIMVDLQLMFEIIYIYNNQFSRCKFLHHNLRYFMNLLKVSPPSMFLWFNLCNFCLNLMINMQTIKLKLNIGMLQIFCSCCRS